MTQVSQQVQPAQKNGIVKKELSIVDSTLQRIEEMVAAGELRLPKDYSAPNALRAAMLLLQDVKDMNKNRVLESCTRDSISYALLKMAMEGLNPMKRQCSFIAYGNKLLMQREYQGSIAIAKRVGMKSIVANPVFKGDVFKWEINKDTGRKSIITHEQLFENYGGEVTGAYAIVEMADGSKNIEVMSMPQIRQAWNQGPTKGQSPAHKNFPDQMACKTVINRSVKTIINSSDDASLFDDDEPAETPFTAGVKHEISSNANRNEIGFEDEPIQNAEEVKDEPVADDNGEMINDSQDAQEETDSQTGKAPF